ncbi:MAG: PBP1A family penicillin-binding protein [Thermoanaerobaculia bacterium]|nr:PBP1A family penicillin-binding protein [Thermoanaerobaculia bacterium]
MSDHRTPDDPQDDPRDSAPDLETGHATSEAESILDQSDFDHDFRTATGQDTTAAPEEQPSSPQGPLRDREPEPDPDLDARNASATMHYAASAGRKESSRKKPKSAEERRRGLRTWLVFPVVTVVLATLTGIVVAASIHRPQVEELDQFIPRLVTEVFDRHGQVVARYSRENRIMLQEGDIPDVLQHAIIATEDANFFHHGGVDLKGVVRAAITNVRAGEIEEGASTLTMQLARNLFSLSRERAWWRKIEEAFLAVELEKNYSKQQILTMYANVATNLGHGNYGMEAAARSYFNKGVGELTLTEAATLAGIPQRPSAFSVYRNPEAVVERRNWVLARMLSEGYIGQSDYDEAIAEPLLVVQRQREAQLGKYFSEEVRRHLIDTYGATELYDRGLHVATTLDPQIQRVAEHALRKQLVTLDHGYGWRGAPRQIEGDDLEERKLPSWTDAELAPGRWFEGLVLSADRKVARVRHQDQIFELGPRGIEWTRKARPDQLLSRGDVAWFRLALPDDAEEDAEPYLVLEQEPQIEGAVLVLEASTGAVRGMVGGWDYDRNEFNRAIQARRQVGSAFKPFVFGAALENGYTAADTLFDGPAVFRGATEDDLYSPRNYYRRYYGITTMRVALEKSVNVTSVKLMDLVGIDRVIDFARRTGVQSELPPYPSLALGSADMSPLEIAAAYSTFVNQGIYVEPYLIEKITSRNGRLLEEHLPRASKAMEPQIAYVLTKMLQGVALRGTAAGRLARLDIATGGKTGTTNDYTDAWFIGFTPRYTLLSWVGYDKKRSLGRGMTGAKAALPIWADVVEAGLEEGWLQPGEHFSEPPGISTAWIDGDSGLLWAEGGQRKVQEIFVEGTAPNRKLDRETARILLLPWYLQEPFYLPKEGERMPSQIEDWTAVRDVWSKKNEREDES